MKKRVWWLMLFIVVLCERHSTPQERAAVSPKVQQVVGDWLHCGECNEGQWEAVLSIGGGKAIALLEELVKVGPSRDEIVIFDAHSLKQYNYIKRYALRNSDFDIEMSDQEFLEMCRSNYIAAQKIRAAEGLLRLQGREAKNTIDEGMRRANRADVKAVLGAMLRQIERM